MPDKKFETLDGNEAVARVAYALNEVSIIYPITPSSSMGEWADTWSAQGKANLWGTIPSVVEMQSEGGAAGAVHGALQSGSLTTTFTASQGLLLMIPNMYKIAGELTPTVFHVSARSLAAQALSIFGDHSDVNAARATGFAMLCSASVQEAHDFALIAQAATLESRVPFLHFFDGFRTSHEVQKIEILTHDQMRALIRDETILEHRQRAMTPDRPVLRGTAQNPDVYFQAREAANPYYLSCPEKVQQAMNAFAEQTGRQYNLFDYHGHPEAEVVIALMGSGCETAHEAVDYLVAQGEKVGILKVRLYRPFDQNAFLQALPASTRRIAVLDRTKEPGSLGEPLYLEVIAAIMEAGRTSIQVVGGRYGLSSKEFTPAMVKGVFDNLRAPEVRNHFTIGIHDDVTHTSLSYDPNLSSEADSTTRAVFYGLGSDGTVGANKNSIKIIGDETDNYAQGYFVYDSKKSGSVTVSHLRFGPELIRSTYLITEANFVACHQWEFLETLDVLKSAAEGAIFLVNSLLPADQVWHEFPRQVQEQILAKKLKVYGINAYEVAKAAGLGGRINTVMQTCFFALSGILAREEAIEAIKRSIRKSYGKKGEEILQRNMAAVDGTLDQLYPIEVPAQVDADARSMTEPVSDQAPEFVRDVLGLIMKREGDQLPVSAFSCDGSFPTDTAKWEKRNIALEIPVWNPDICVQCAKCVIACPHGTIRSKVYEGSQLEGAPSTFKSTKAKDPNWKNLTFTLQIAAEDCTGCGLCVDICPVKDKSDTSRRAINMAPQRPLRDQERENWDFFLQLPLPDRRTLNVNKIKYQQLQEPLFEFSGACAGCGETPYVKLASQLFGDRMIIANATGCASIYGGNLPTTPWAQNAEGRGPTWSNSLFEDNAEFGMGFCISIEKHQQFATELVQKLASILGDDLVTGLINADQHNEAGIYDQRERVALLKQRLQVFLEGKDRANASEAEREQIDQVTYLLSVADYLVRKSVWIMGGDGWAYDIGFGGLDHVLASGKNLNVLVLDTEVYSNTGGQMSKATPRAAVAKFAAGGRPSAKKDLGLMAMTYGNVYVASVAMGAKDEHTLRVFLEAEAYNGPSLIMAYSHCIAHGINMRAGMQQQKLAVDTGRWLLYRYNPDRVAQGENPLILDSRSPSLPIEKSMYSENRFKMLTHGNPAAAKALLEQAQQDVRARWNMYHYLANRQIEQVQNGNSQAPASSTPTAAPSPQA